MIVRRAHPGDASEITRLNGEVQQLHADAYPWMFKHTGDPASLPEDHVRSELSRPVFIGFIAEIEGLAVGYAIAEERRRGHRRVRP